MTDPPERDPEPVSETDHTVQYVTNELGPYLASNAPLRFSFQITGLDGEVLLDHRCQQMGLLREVKNRLWRRARAMTEPLACGFQEEDNPGSTLVFACTEPLDDGRLYFYVTVPGGAVKVPVCDKHRAMLEERERDYAR